jgi:hypothetical protein
MLMVRWEPNASQRLANAALELFTERGYENTTVLDIAKRAEFGDPLTTDAYTLCLYDGTGLLAGLTADAGGSCTGKPCWRSRTNGFPVVRRIGTKTRRADVR